MPDINPSWLVIGSAAVALVPIAVGVATSYVKVSIVLGMIRSALGAQQMPSGLVVMALSLVITWYVMAPVLEKTMEGVSQTELANLQQAPDLKKLKNLLPALEPWREFMSKGAGPRELALLAELAKDDRQSFRVLMPAFLLSELKEAFAMGFVLLLPFLVIDLIVSNILVGLGMFMVSPMMISLPLKLILFVSCDGWLLITKGLIKSYAL